MWQLPPEATPVAVGVLFYSFICEICSILIVWLLWTHNERLSYVACISYFTLLSTTSSIIQQLHDYIFWADVISAQFDNILRNVGNPELVIANGSIGMDLALFYIQFCSYSIESMFSLFWAFSLTSSVYGWSAKPHLRSVLSRINTVGKIVSVLLPVLMISLLQVPAIQNSFVGFILMADFLFFFSATGGTVFLIMILAKYIQSRKQFRAWSVDYGKKSQSQGSSGVDHGATKTVGHSRRKSAGIYDRWLIVRFTTAFVVLSLFEITNVLFQVMGQQNNTRDALTKTPNLSAERAQQTVLLNMPGVSASLLAFVVFGTTRPFREHMYKTFVPRRLRERIQAAAPSPQGPSYGSNTESRFSKAHRRHTSMQLSKGVDVEIGMDDLSSSRRDGDGQREGDYDDMAVTRDTALRSNTTRMYP